MFLNSELIDFTFKEGLTSRSDNGWWNFDFELGKEGPGSSYIYLCEILQNKVMKATSEATET